MKETFPSQMEFEQATTEPTVLGCNHWLLPKVDVAWEYWICNFKVFKNHHHQVSSSNWPLKACLVSSLYTSKGFFLSFSWRCLPTSNCVFLFHTSLSLFCPTHPFWWHKIWRCIFNHTSQGDTWWWWWYYSSSFFLDWAKILHTPQNFSAIW